MSARLGVWATAGIVALAGCATEPKVSRPTVALPAQFTPAIAAPATPAPATSIIGDWWTLYGDAALSDIVAAALKNNTDLALAVARVDESAAVLGLTRSAQWPSLDLGASVTRSRLSTLNAQPVPPGGAESTTHRAALTTAFEIDLWGRLRNASAAARQQMLAAVFARDTVQLALTASAAQLYFGLRSLDAQLAVNEVQMRSRAESLRLVDRRAAGGVASALDAALARTALAAVRAQRPELQRQRALLEHQLAQLTGRPGLGVDPATTPMAQSLTLPATPPPGLPAQLLERRPDVRQAEAQLGAAQIQIDVARAAVWPTVSLTGSLGVQSASLADLLKSGAQIWSIGPSVLVSLFDAGRNVARTDQARAQAEQAAIGYQKAALTAFRETADALVNVEQGGLQEVEVEAQRREANEALRIANRRYESGYSGFLDVLEAQRGVQDAELALVRVRQARLEASVALIKALGGGWQAPKP
jgi:outer membrane protein, multidrug efflux system